MSDDNDGMYDDAICDDTIFQDMWYIQIGEGGILGP